MHQGVTRMRRSPTGLHRPKSIKGNTVPFDTFQWYSRCMHKRLTDFQIRAVCAELLARDASASGREVRRTLFDRFGSVGKTERVFAVWREEMRKARFAAEAQSLPAEVYELQERLKLAQAKAAANLARAELAEYRERAHQDHWALEIDRVKRELEEARREAADGQGRGSRAFSV